MGNDCISCRIARRGWRCCFQNVRKSVLRYGCHVYLPGVWLIHVHVIDPCYGAPCRYDCGFTTVTLAGVITETVVMAVTRLCVIVSVVFVILNRKRGLREVFLQPAPSAALPVGEVWHVPGSSDTRTETSRGTGIVGNSCCRWFETACCDGVLCLSSCDD